MQYAWPVWPCQLELVTLHRTVGTEFGNPDSSLIMPDFDLSGELSLKIELHMLRPITEKVHSGNGPVSLVRTHHLFLWAYLHYIIQVSLWKLEHSQSYWGTPKFQTLALFFNRLLEVDNLKNPSGKVFCLLTRISTWRYVSDVNILST